MILHGFCIVSSWFIVFYRVKCSFRIKKRTKIGHIFCFWRVFDRGGEGKRQRGLYGANAPFRKNKNFQIQKIRKKRKKGFIR